VIPRLANKSGFLLIYRQERLLYGGLESGAQNYHTTRREFEQGKNMSQAVAIAGPTYDAIVESDKKDFKEKKPYRHGQTNRRIY
jgi:hypothetical protein